MDASSSSVAATITTVEAAAAAVAVTVRIAVDRGKEKKHDDEIILQTVIGKCHIAMKIDHIRFLLA